MLKTLGWDDLQLPACTRLFGNSYKARHPLPVLQSLVIFCLWRFRNSRKSSGVKVGRSSIQTTAVEYQLINYLSISPDNITCRRQFHSHDFPPPNWVTLDNLAPYRYEAGGLAALHSPGTIRTKPSGRWRGSCCLDFKDKSILVVDLVLLCFLCGSEPAGFEDYKICQAGRCVVLGPSSEMFQLHLSSISLTYIESCQKRPHLGCRVHHPLLCSSVGYRGLEVTRTSPSIGPVRQVTLSWT